MAAPKAKPAAAATPAAKVKPKMRKKEKKNVSVGLVKAIDLAVAEGATIFGIVGKADGYTYKMGNCVEVIPQVADSRITPHSEAFQGVV